MIGRSGERGSGISVQAARHDDDEIYIYICIISNSTSTFLTKIGLSPGKKREYIYKKIQNKTVTEYERMWPSYRLKTTQ